MALTSGMRLGPYEIQSQLGAGGMGEVYRARDTRLGREVAIKVLPPALAQDAEHLRRFEQEARTIATLNHPNILAIHDIGTYQGVSFLVSELLEGETLRTKLEAGPLPARRAVDVALGVAHGLTAAHEKGIVHRDLKPENVFLSREGRVKVLDFGLAKLVRSEDRRPSDITLTSADTMPGVVLGTVGYMSPEQVRAETTDSRSDIFSFGAVLYEIISGKRAFKRTSSIETMNAILKEEPPDLTVTGLHVNHVLERITRRCLEKSPDHRFQSASDLAFALETITGTSGSTVGASAAKRSNRLWLMALVAGLIAITALVWFLRRQFAHAPSAEIKFTRFSFREGTIISSRFSPDGEMILYTAAFDGQPPELYSVRRDYPDSQPVGIKGAHLLAVSRKGQLALLLRAKSLAHFVAEGTLATAPIGSTTPREIAEHVISADWSPDGNDLAIARYVDSRCRVEYPLGKSLYETDGWIDQLRVSPDGKHLAFLQHPYGSDDRGDVIVSDLSGSMRKISTGWAAEEGLSWAPSGEEIWFSATNAGSDLTLHAVSLDGTERIVRSQAGGLRIQDISAAGQVLLSRDELVSRTELFPGAAPPRDISWLNYSWYPTLSRDGSLIAILDQSNFGGNQYSVYLRRMDESSPVRLGTGQVSDISPNKKWVAALDLIGGLSLLPIGPGETRRLRWNQMEIDGATFLPDSQRVLLIGTDNAHHAHFYVSDLNGSAPRQVGGERHTSRSLTVSPDGKSFTYDDKGQWMIEQFGGGASEAIPGMGPDEWVVRWTGDGKSLFVLHEGDDELTLYRLFLATGRRELLRKLRPTWQLGLVSMRHGYFGFDVDAAGRNVAMSYETNTGALFTADGMK